MSRPGSAASAGAERGYDVVVAGGGTAGVAAAVAASREGARTCLVERDTVLGGAQTGGWVTPSMACRMGAQPLIAGIHGEILDRYARLRPSPWNGDERDYLWFDPVILQCVFDEMTVEAGVTCRFQTCVVDARVDAGKIAFLLVADPLGVRRIAGRAFIDATGDAAVAVLAGAPWVSGRASDGRNQPMSLRFVVGNVDLDEVCRFFSDLDPDRVFDLPRLCVGYPDAADGPLASRVRAAVDEGILETDDLGYFQFFAIVGRPRDIAFNGPRLAGFDPLDPVSRSDALRDGRRRVLRIHSFLETQIPGFAQSWVSVIASALGVRESRRIVGEYTLTADDLIEARQFTDGICNCNYPIDIHDPTGAGGTVIESPPPGTWYQVPYRCLVPRDVENLLVAGRCVSSTFEAQAGIRVQAPCRAMGEAAGAAAAICAASGVRPRDIDPQLLRERLRDHGALVD